MKAKSQYKTRQHMEILSYLEQTNGEHITVNDICNHFREQGKNIGTTTVYRQLEHMVDEGIVQKYIFQVNPLRTVIYGICSECRT